MLRLAELVKRGFGLGARSSDIRKTAAASLLTSARPSRTHRYDHDGYWPRSSLRARPKVLSQRDQAERRRHGYPQHTIYSIRTGTTRYHHAHYTSGSLGFLSVAALPVRGRLEATQAALR
jgi:hypothetical protein